MSGQNLVYRPIYRQTNRCKTCPLLFKGGHKLCMYGTWACINDIHHFSMLNAQSKLSYMQDGSIKCQDITGNLCNITYRPLVNTWNACRNKLLSVLENKNKTSTAFIIFYLVYVFTSHVTKLWTTYITIFDLRFFVSGDIFILADLRGGGGLWGLHHPPFQFF